MVTCGGHERATCQHTPTLRKGGDGMFHSIRNEIGDAFKGYPFRSRVIAALITLGMLLIVSLKWRFEWAKIIAIAAFTVARLFDLKGRWSIFFIGIGSGDLLL